MCISINPAEFSGTTIAYFPERDGRAVLSYTNTAKSAGHESAGTADGGPNALIFPVFGTDVEVLDCPDPQASRAFLAAARGLYNERWESPSNFDLFNLDQINRLGGYSEGIKQSGNYLVGVADGVEEIAVVLESLRRHSPRPEYVPQMSDQLAEMMDRYYRALGMGMPQFVVGAFLLDPSQPGLKNPISVGHTPLFPGKVILPALDYHGKGDAFEPYARRDHTLALSSPELQEVLAPVMRIPQGGRPLEFAAAPPVFPVLVRDTRKLTREAVENTLAHQNNPEFAHLFDPKLSRQQLESGMAPNNDYVFDTAAMALELAPHMPAIKQECDDYARSRSPQDRIVNKKLAASQAIKTVVGQNWAMRHSNQIPVTVEAYQDTHAAIEQRVSVFFGELAA